MLDPHGAHVKVVGDAILPRKLPYQQALLGRLDVLVRREVVHHQDHPPGIEDLLQAQLAKLLDGKRGGDVVGQHQVQPAVKQFSGDHPVLISVGGQDLFGNGHAHMCSS